MDDTQWSALLGGPIGHWACAHDKKRRFLEGSTYDMMWLVWCEKPGCPEWNRLFMFDGGKQAEQARKIKVKE